MPRKRIPRATTLSAGQRAGSAPACRAPALRLPPAGQPWRASHADPSPQETPERLTARVGEILQANPRRSLQGATKLVLFIEDMFPLLLALSLAYQRDKWRPEAGLLGDVRTEGYDLYIAFTCVIADAELTSPLPTQRECWWWLRTAGHAPPGSWETVRRKATRLQDALVEAISADHGTRSAEQARLLARYPVAASMLHWKAAEAALPASRGPAPSVSYPSREHLSP